MGEQLRRPTRTQVDYMHNYCFDGEHDQSWVTDFPLFAPFMKAADSMYWQDNLPDVKQQKFNAIRDMHARQHTTRARAHPNCLVLLRLDSTEANKTLPICVHDPRTCMVLPPLFAELQQQGALGIPHNVTTRMYI